MAEFVAAAITAVAASAGVTLTVQTAIALAHGPVLLRGVNVPRETRPAPATA